MIQVVPVRSAHRPIVRLDHVWLGVVPLLVALKVLLTPIAPYDFWWHLAYGRAILPARAIPTGDPFSYTRSGEPFFNQPWLAQVLMYLGYQLVGAAGLQIVQALVVAGAYALLVRICESSGADRRVAVVATLLAASATYDNWNIRPQTYVLPLWVIVIGLLQRWRRKGHTPWMLAPLVALWSNLHGTFTLPLALAGIFLVGETIRCRRGVGARSHDELLRLASALGLAFVASCLNPHGIRVWLYTFTLLRNRAISELVTEWAPPQFGTAGGTLFFGLLLIAAIALIVRWRHLTMTELLALGPFLLLALSAGRNIIWFAALAAALIAPLWHGSHRRRKRESSTLNALILALLCLPVILVSPPFKPGLNLPPRLGALLDPETPVAAVTAMQRLSDRPARLFHDLAAGSYLTWALPDQAVFIDPRIEHYPLDQWHDYIRLGQGQELAALQARYNFDGYLINPVTQADLLDVLQKDPRWQETVHTDAAILFQPVRSR